MSAERWRCAVACGGGVVSLPVGQSLVGAVTGHIGDARACSTGDSRLAFERAWPIFERGVRFKARRITKEPHMQKDLIQEAMITLWKADPTRYNLKRRDARGYVRQMLKNRMLNVWRAEGARRADVSLS